MIRNVIEKRPWTIILAWIIIVALLAQYAGQLNNVVQTQTEKFLPENVESVKADNALQKIQEEYGVSAAMKPDYLVLIHGVPVNLDTYYKLRDPYMRLYHEYNDSIFSWINIVYNIEQEIYNGTYKGINNTVPAVQGLIQINQAYNQTLQGLNQTSQLVTGMDQAYMHVYQAIQGIAIQRNNLTSLEQSYLAGCNKILPSIALTYYNVTRTEYYLETLTNAYQTGNLTTQDIITVVNATNLSRIGINPVEPGLVEAVFYSTLSLGGPQVVNNTVLAGIAENLVIENLNRTGQPQSVIGLARIAGTVWSQAVAQLPDYKIILGEGPVKGQVELLNLTLQVLQQAKPGFAQALTSYYQSSLPAQSAALANFIEESLIKYNCSEASAQQALVEAVANYLASMGLPAGEALTGLVQQALAMGQVNKTLALQEAAVLVAEKLPSGGAAGRLGRMLPIVEGVVLRFDPFATGNLTGERALVASAVIVLETSNITVDNNIMGLLESSSNTIENETITILKLILQKQNNTQAIGLLQTLARQGLLGVDNEKLLSQAPSILAKMIAEKANISEATAVKIAEAAVEVYQGKTNVSLAAENLTRQSLEQAWPNITKKLKGTLIEKNEQGWLTAYTPKPGTSLDDGVKNLQNLADDLRKMLEDNGFKNPKILLGGNKYMTWEMRIAAQKDIERSDRISMVLVVIILALVLESIAAVLLPFIGIGMGLIASMAIAYFLAKGGIIEVTTHSRTIMYTTGLGLGIDYAAYVSKRFREAAARGLKSREAAGEAFSRSWRAVIAGATTAAIGFGSMLLARDFPFITSIGSNVPLTIIGVMIASITFIPALLAYVGERNWFWWPRHPVETAKKNKSIAVSTVGSLVKRWWIPLAIVVIMAVGAYAVMSGFQGSYDLALNLPKDSMSAKTIHAINTYYEPGVLYPVYIIVSNPSKAQAVASSVENLTCVSKTVIPSEYHDKVVFAYMSINPLSYQGVECAKQIREAAHQADPGSLVGGMSEVNLDLKNEINTVFYHKVYPVAILLMFLTFLGVYGGVAVALSAVVGVALAAYAGSALTIIVYRNILGTQVLWYLPVIVFTAILGVGMDYNSFFIARAREECERSCSEKGLMEAIKHATPIVLGLATIMAGAYIGLAATKTPGLSEMGAALVLGVLIAGLNAAVLLTPPLVKVLGRRAWWPRPPREE